MFYHWASASSIFTFLRQGLSKSLKPWTVHPTTSGSKRSGVGELGHQIRFSFSKCYMLWGQTWWHIHLISALGKQSKWISGSLRSAWSTQKLQGIQGDTVRPCLFFIPKTYKLWNSDWSNLTLASLITTQIIIFWAGNGAQELWTCLVWQGPGLNPGITSNNE